MQVIDNLIQKIRNIPESVRDPHISNKEIEKMANSILIAHEYEQVKRMEIK
jgi:hypothetical protein